LPRAATRWPHDENNSLRHHVRVNGQLPSAHRLGFAVKVLGDAGLPSHDTRRWSSNPHLRRSLERLRDILDYLERHDIRMYRLPTGLAPYASHPHMPQFHRQVQECAEELAQVGAIVRERAIRLSSHPGQYTVLNSENPDTQAAAIAELEVQAALMDAMGLGPEAVVVLHVGGAAGGLDAARDRFLAGFERLSERARTRLVVENDDRTFGLVDVLALSARSGVRIVWDVLHHRCHDPAGMSNREALAAALDTWRNGDGLPKIHYSSPRLDVEQRRVTVGRRTETKLVLPQLRAHADLIDPIGFEAFLRDAPAGRSFDIMLEAKAKDLALLRLREQLAERGLVSAGGSVLVAGS
jgi:UV DNA damage endonuclease